MPSPERYLRLIILALRFSSLQSFVYWPDPITSSTLILAAMMMSMSPKNNHNATFPSVASVSDQSSTDGKSMLVCSSNSSSHYEELIVAPHVGYKKVLVTGGAGFVGSSVAEALLARGDDVVIVDEMNDYYDVRMKENNLRRLKELYPQDGRLAIYRGDICDEQLMHSLFEKEQPRWVCHMAARAGVRPSIQDPYVYIHSNIVGTTLLMEMSHKFGVQNFVFASSSSVYGGSKSTYFSEGRKR